VRASRSPARLVVLVSGTGSNLSALLDAVADPAYGAQVVAVGADRGGIPALDNATAAGVPTYVVCLTDHADRAAWDRALTAATAEHHPDLVVCAGFMKLLGPAFLDRFGPRIINTHPALLPSFPGARPVHDTLAHGVKLTGVTVHVVDAGLDSGPILAQAAVPVRDDDDEERLHGRIKSVERALLVETVGRLARGGFRVEGRKAVFL
jgi:phosphoribosylglycinamide formyltransferase 1